MRITLFSIKDYNIKIKMSTYLEIQMQSFNVLFFRNNFKKCMNVTFFVLYNKKCRKIESFSDIHLIFFQIKLFEYILTYGLRR